MVESQPTWLDRFCERWAPGVAVNRAESRLRLAAVNSYHGSIKGRLGAGWEVGQPYNNGSIRERQEIGDMSHRAEQVFANNAIGKSILQTEVTNVVADGYRLQAKATNADGSTDEKTKAWNGESEDRWEIFLDQADVRGLWNGSEMQRRPYRSARLGGDCGIVMVNDGGVSKLQHITRNKIVTPDGKQGDKSFVDGVEVDDSLRPINFHVLDLDEWGKRTWTAISADDFCYILPDTDDDLAVRGTTCYSTCFTQLDRVDGLIDGVAAAAQMAAVFGVVIKSDAAQADFKNLRQVTNAAGNLQRALTLENGSIKIIGSKDDIVQVDAKQPLTQTPEWIRTMLRIIGLPFDMPLELIAHDMSQVNFASARIGLLQYYRSCKSRQKQYIATWSRIYRWWVSRERKRQQLGLPGAFVSKFPALYWPHSHHPRAWGYTDPVREAQSDFIQMDMGTKAPQDVAAEQGRDWEETQIKLAAANAWRKLNGLATDIRSTLSRDVISVRSDDPKSVAGEDAGSKPGEADPAGGSSGDDDEDEE